METDHLLQALRGEIAAISTTHRAAVVMKLAAIYYSYAPQTDNALLDFCETLIASCDSDLFAVATLWIKRRKTVIDLKHFPRVEGWLYRYIDGWGRCDQFCYRVLNPFVDKYPELFTHVMKWTRAEQTYVRRAAPVSLIRIGVGIRVKTKFDRVLQVVEVLRGDTHPHIQKGIGWLLKYAYQPYPQEVLDYLSSNATMLSRTTYRYALELVPEEVRADMMRLS